MPKVTEKRCYCCLYYHAYYTKGIGRFEKLGYGFCDKTHEALQDKHATCGKWRTSCRRKKEQIAIASAVLENAANSINELKQILYEARAEEGIN